MRVGDADRAEIADLLARHYSDGRLDRAEFDQRLDQAMRAKTRASLLAVLTDLPDMARAQPSQSRAQPAQQLQRPVDRTRRRRTLSPLPGIILIVVLVLLLGHVARTAVWIAAVALLCLWLLARSRRA